MDERTTAIESASSLDLRSPLKVLWEALRDPHSYNPLENHALWIGLLWGIPIPILFLWFHATHNGAPALELFQNHPVHWVFALHPVFFAVVFGVVGSINRHYINRLKEESVRDGMTGLYNHRFFQEELRRRLGAAERYERGISVILFDLDHFKRINDRYGHLRGDRVLVRLSQRLQEQTRDPDVVCRYGGEEFGVILPETGVENAVTFAERIRAGVETANFGMEDRLTLSGGVAGYPEDGMTVNDLIQAADQRLYRAKDAGRNRIVGPDPEVDPEADRARDVQKTVS